MLRISEIEKESVAEELGISAGSFLVSINKKKPSDILDMMFYDTFLKLKVVIQETTGQITEYKIFKEKNEKLGIVIEGFENINVKYCRNNCLFCNCDQMPPNVYKTKLVKEEDWRNSFLNEKYVTMSNISNADIKRIIDQKISPLYISVHCINEKIRKKILGVNQSYPILKMIKLLTKKNIKVHCKIILCPGVNDGHVLSRTIRELLNCGKNLESIAVVPVELTKYRPDINQLRSVEREDAVKVLNIIHRQSDRFFSKRKQHAIFASDEFYVLAGQDFPSYSYYGDFSQLNNNAGFQIKFETEFMQQINQGNFKDPHINLTIISGETNFDFLNRIANFFNYRYFMSNINVLKIINNYFGERITTDKYLSATDISGQISSLLCHDTIVIPEVCLKENNRIFLDNITFTKFEKVINKKIFIYSDAQSLTDIIFGGKK